MKRISTIIIFTWILLGCASSAAKEVELNGIKFPLYPNSYNIQQTQKNDLDKLTFTTKGVDSEILSWYADNLSKRGFRRTKIDQVRAEFTKSRAFELTTLQQGDYSEGVIFTVFIQPNGSDCYIEVTTSLFRQSIH